MFIVYAESVVTREEVEVDCAKTRHAAEVLAHIAAEDMADEKSGTGRAVVREADGMAWYYVAYRAGYYRVLDLNAGDMSVLLDSRERVVRPAELPSERRRRFAKRRAAKAAEIAAHEARAQAYEEAARERTLSPSERGY